jgi:hypothetical protein
MTVSRRDFLKLGSASVLAAQMPVLAWRRAREALAAEPQWCFFTDAEDQRTLEALVDRMIPADFDLNGEPSPGAKNAGVAHYVDFLLGAFAGMCGVPFIYAGGPFSDRNPDPLGLRTGAGNDMATPLSLTPEQSLSWRIKILGLAAVEQSATDPAEQDRLARIRQNLETAGIDAPVGYQTQWRDGLDALKEMGFADLPEPLQDAALLRPDLQEFLLFAFEHVVEGMYSNPEYRGNQPGGDGVPIGWKNAFFEGDRQPLGYTIFNSTTGAYEEIPDHPVSGPNPGIPDLLVLDPETTEAVGQAAVRMRAHPGRVIGR